MRFPRLKKIGFLALLALGVHVAAACTPDPSCPTNTVCLTWTTPPLRQDGTAQLASDLGPYTVYLDTTRVLGTVPGTVNSFNYAVPAGTCINTGHPWNVQSSSITSGTNAKSISASAFLCASVCGPTPIPPPPPAPPSGVAVQGH